MSDDNLTLAHVAELEADNRRLRRLLDQGGAPGELRHRLRNTLALLRIIIRKSARPDQSVESFAAHVEGRLNAIARAQAMIDDFGFIRFSTLLADELLAHAVSEGERAELSGPEVFLQPRAGQVLALALHELTINAVEYGNLGGEGKTRVHWSVIQEGEEPVFEMCWEEQERSSQASMDRRGFGVEVLTRMLPYELKAVTRWQVDDEGLRFTMRLPFTKDVGHLG
jgi:two-component sensor histidine kinase